MGTYRAALAATMVALGLGQPSLAGGDEALSAEAVVRGRVSAAAGRPVGVETTLSTSSGRWRLICGRPRELDGRPFDIDSSRLAASEYGADFCALVSTADGDAQVVEFDIGSTDMPAIDWVAKHGLPPELLSAP